MREALQDFLVPVCFVAMRHLDPRLPGSAYYLSPKLSVAVSVCCGNPFVCRYPRLSMSKLSKPLLAAIIDCIDLLFLLLPPRYPRWLRVNVLTLAVIPLDSSSLLDMKALDSFTLVPRYCCFS